MRKIFLFMNVSLDGFFEGTGHDISGFQRDNEPFDAHSGESGPQVDTVLLGHETYDMMKSFWPTEQAEKMMPEMAKFMNEKTKLVASHKEFEPGWKNVKVICGDVVGQVKQLKEQPGGSIIIFGSNNLVVSLMQAGLIDEFQILVNPVALGQGTNLFKGLPVKVELKLIGTHTFKSGTVMLTYEPANR